MEEVPRESPAQLIVEGPEDCHFFMHLQNKMYTNNQLPNRAFVTAVGGKANPKQWRKVLKGLRDRSAPITSIGLVCDANSNHEAAFQGLRDILRDVELAIPHKPLEFTSADPRTGILTLPHGRNGIRETLCNEAVAGDDVMPCIDQYMQCLHEVLSGKVDEGGHSLFPRNVEKARLGAYLASRQDTEFRIGIAIQNGSIPWDSPAFAEVRAFLQNLVS